MWKPFAKQITQFWKPLANKNRRDANFCEPFAQTKIVACNFESIHNFANRLHKQKACCGPLAKETLLRTACKHKDVASRFPQKRERLQTVYKHAGTLVNRSPNAQKRLRTVRKNNNAHASPNRFQRCKLWLAVCKQRELFQTFRKTKRRRLQTVCKTHAHTCLRTVCKPTKTHCFVNRLQKTQKRLRPDRKQTQRALVANRCKQNTTGANHVQHKNANLRRAFAKTHANFCKPIAENTNANFGKPLANRTRTFTDRSQTKHIRLAANRWQKTQICAHRL